MRATRCWPSSRSRSRGARSRPRRREAVCLVPRIRSLKPEHRQHRKVGRLTHRQYRLWVGMICEADDVGRLVAEPDQLRVTIFGYHPSVKTRDVSDDLAKLRELGSVRLYSHNGTLYADFPSWTEHQRIDHPSKSKLPEYNDSENAREDSRGLANNPGGSEGSGSEGSGSGRIGGGGALGLIRQPPPKGDLH